MYLQLILEDHCADTDLWPWGGEPIYRNGKYVGMTTTTGYGYTFQKQAGLILISYIMIEFHYSIVLILLQVCLGFVENIDEKGERQKVTNEYITNGDFEVDIAGIKYVKCSVSKLTIFI